MTARMEFIAMNSFVRRGISSAIAATLAVTVLAGLPETAHANNGRGDAPAVRSVKPIPVHPVRGKDRDIKAQPSVKPKKWEWPDPAHADIAPGDWKGAGRKQFLQAGDLPVSIALPDSKSRGAEVKVEVADRESAKALGLVGPAIVVEQATIEDGPVPSPAEFATADPSSDLSPTTTAVTDPMGGNEPRALRVRLDVADLMAASSGDLASRLQLMRFPACALTTPELEMCSTGTPLPTKVDLESGTLTVDLTADDLVPLVRETAVNDSEEPTSTESAEPSASAEPEASPSVSESSSASESPRVLWRPAPFGRIAQVATVDGGGGGTVLGVGAAASGPAGDWKATSFAASGSWTGGNPGGSFDWSYPIQLPPIAGPLRPDLSLSYSSSAVDGRTSSRNNQASWVGDGFDLGSGFVERTYVGCLDDRTSGANNTRDTGDLCWDDEVLNMSFGSWSGELVPVIDPTTGNDAFRLRQDNGARIERVGDVGDAGSEYFKLTTPDGTQYFFGKGSATTGDEPPTESRWKVPVYGNHAGEPCHGAVFTDSDCDQVWRWNLDYVLDVRNNSIVYKYQRETNRYARNLTDTDAVEYDRGGYLKLIEYGSRGGTEDTATAPATVTFEVDERCVPGGTGCAPAELTEASAARWPDVPFDQMCTSSTNCEGRYSPTFFTRKRLAEITTKVAGRSTAVDTWTLKHSYPDPGDGSSAAMWLSDIERSNLGTTSFAGTMRANRVDTLDNALSLKRNRVQTISDEFGRLTTVVYYGAGCTSTTLPASVVTNNKRCFPEYYTAPGNTEPDATPHWFHKYVVKQVIDADTVEASSDDVVTNYAYASAAWAKDDSPRTKPGKRTWNQWRGYSTVTTTVGGVGTDPNGTTATQLETVSTYYRGMDGDPDASGDPRTFKITDSVGVETTDHWRLQGMVRESRTLQGAGGAQVSSTITDYSHPKARERITGGTRDAMLALEDATHTRTQAEFGSHRTDVATSYDTYFRPAELTDAAYNVSAAGADTLVDKTCTQTTYVERSTAWQINLPKTTRILNGACAAVPANSAVLSNKRFYYDDHTLSAAPTKGNLTKAEELDRFDGAGAAVYVAASTVYDTFSRPTSVTDALGRTSTTSYTGQDVTGAAPTKVTATSPDPDGSGPLTSHVTATTYDASRSVPTKVVAPSGATTNASYDALGRLVKVWLPGRAISETPDKEFQYGFATDGAANTITTLILQPLGGTQKSVQLLDGLLRLRQTQTESSSSTGATGRIVTNVMYDSRGFAVRTESRIFAQGAPNTSVVAVAGTVPEATTSTFDGAGRPLRNKTIWGGTDIAEAVTTYAGNLTSVLPPTGGTASETRTDARGRTTSLKEFATSGAGFTGPSTTLTYKYTVLGQLKEIQDSAGNSWDYDYDLRGSRTSSSDPDAGTSSRTFDAVGQLATSTDAEGQTLAYAYDALGRMTEVRDDGLSGAKRATWTYDAPVKGMAAASTRFIDGVDAYTTKNVAYDSGYRLLQAETVIKAVPGLIPAELAGTYTSTAGYLSTGALDWAGFGAAGPLAAEKVAVGYDADGRASTLIGSLGAYVVDTKWSVFGELDQLALGNTYGRISWQSNFYNANSGRLERTQVDRQQQTDFDETAHYRYDKSGNVLERRAEEPGPTAAVSDNVVIDRECFEIDGLQQLTEAWTASSECSSARSTDALAGVNPYWTSWTYDNATGNRTTQTERSLTSPDGPVEVVHSEYIANGGRPHAVERIDITGPGSQASAKAFSYDAAGRVTERLGHTITWDAEGRATEIAKTSDPTAVVQKAAYGPAGDRFVTVTDNGQITTLFLPDGTELEHDAGQPSGSRTSSTRYYEFAGRTVAVREGNTVESVDSIIDDPQGTATFAINNKTGALSGRRLAPFGSPRRDASDWPGRRDFVGGTADADAGLIQLGARPYDPAIGRFLAVDPLLDTSSSRQINGYSYANNNPVTLSDPSGLDPMFHCSTPGCHNTMYSGTPAVQDQLATDAQARGEAEARRTEIASHPRLSDPVNRGAFDLWWTTGMYGPDYDLPYQTRAGGTVCYGFVACDKAARHISKHPDDLAGAIDIAANYCFENSSECMRGISIRNIGLSLNAGALSLAVPRSVAGRIGGPTGGKTSLWVAAQAPPRGYSVHWDRQGKHIPGHRNFIPTKSVLTADPNVLIGRAGTGVPVGAAGRGEPGFRERIDFGTEIGVWRGTDGSSARTSIGILHYTKDGQVHIVPGRPQ